MICSLRALVVPFIVSIALCAPAAPRISPDAAFEIIAAQGQQKGNFKNFVKAIGFPKTYESQILNYLSAQKLSEQAPPFMNLHDGLLHTDGVGTHKISFDPKTSVLMLNDQKIKISAEASEEAFSRTVTAIEKAMKASPSPKTSLYDFLLSKAQAETKDELLRYAQLRTNSLKTAAFVGVVAATAVGAIVNPALAIATLSAGTYAAAECDKKGDYCPVVNQDLIKTALGQQNELQSFQCSSGIPSFKINGKEYEFDAGGKDFKSIRSFTIKGETACDYNLYWSISRLEAIVKEVAPATCAQLPPETSVEKAFAGIPVRRMFECCLSKSECQNSMKAFAKATPFKKNPKPGAGAR